MCSLLGVPGLMFSLVLSQLLIQAIPFRAVVRSIPHSVKPAKRSGCRWRPDGYKMAETQRLSHFRKRMRLFSAKARKFDDELMAAEALTSEQLHQLNWMRRKSLVEYSFDNVPFYNELYMQAGYQNGDLKSERDFETLPVLEKQHILEHADRLFSKESDMSKARKVTTGGTTGVPLSVFNDPNVPLHVISWRALNRWSVDIGDNSGYLYRAVPSLFGQIARKMAFFPTKRSYISASAMNAKNMEQFARNLAAGNPTYMVGYVGALDEFARFCAPNGLSFPSVKAIWSTAAPLPAGTRRLLSDVFGAPVYSQYGSCEFYWIAAECKAHSGLHIESDIRHVESVDEYDRQMPNGKLGDLLVTDLMNYTFPLIRYRLGDRGATGLPPCSCGSPFPLMSYVQGRTTDFIHLPDGRRIPGEFFTTIFDDFPEAVGAFSVRQTISYELIVSYEPKSAEAAQVINLVNQRLLEATENSIGISFRAVGSIEHSAGKPKFVESEIHG